MLVMEEMAGSDCILELTKKKKATEDCIFYCLIYVVDGQVSMEIDVSVIKSTN